MQFHRTLFTTNHTANEEYQILSRTTNSTDHDAKLGWILVNKNLISEDQLHAVLDRQLLDYRQVGKLLTEQQLISEEQLQQALKEQHWRRNGYWVI
jgi:hypothetical protein